MRRKRNYLYFGLGTLFLIAIIILVAYSVIIPIEGCIGVIEISGPIVAQDIAPTVFTDEIIGSETIAKQIENADKNEEVKSVLVLIDSPGGSVVASREIYNALYALEKPSVSYIHEHAASGGYYAAAATDYIVANPDSITGSIGARATFAEMSGLFEKIGLNETVVKSGEMKDIGSPSRPMTPEELEVIESIVNEIFIEFRDAVEKNREGKLDAELFEQALDARILSGRQAKKIGLVDELGSKKDAIQKAAQVAGIEAEEPKMCELSTTSGQKGLLSLSADALEFLMRSATGPRILYQ